MADSEKALVINPVSTKARISKAEALYSMGHFEKALVEFERVRWSTRLCTQPGHLGMETETGP